MLIVLGKSYSPGGVEAIGSVGGSEGTESGIESVGGVEGFGSVGGMEGMGSVGGVEGTESGRGGIGGGDDNDKFNRRPTMIPISATKSANLKEKPGPFLLLIRLFNVSCKSKETQIISPLQYRCH